MTQDQISAYLRTLCTAAGTLLVGQGILTAQQVTTLTTFVLAVPGVVLLGISLYGSWKAHSEKGVVKAAAKVEGTQIVTQSVIAQDLPQNVTSNVNTKVVPQ